MIYSLHLEGKSKLSTKNLSFRSKSKRSKAKYLAEYKSLSKLPLTEQYNKKTDLNDSGNGDIFYLDRHNIECTANSALTAFRLGRQNDKIFYNYNCKTSAAISKKDFVEKTTNFENTDSDSTNSANYLDRHHVECPENYILQKFQLIRDGSKIAYKFRCVKFIGTDCKQAFTDETLGAKKRETFYLDRQRFLLEPDRALRGFRLTTRYDGENAFYRYSYTSCKLDDVESRILKIKNKIEFLNEEAYNKLPKLIEAKDKFIKEKTELNKTTNKNIEQYKDENKKNAEQILSLKITNQQKLDFVNGNKTLKKQNKLTIQEKNLDNENQRNFISKTKSEISALELKRGEFTIQLKGHQDRKTTLENELKSAANEIAEKDKIINEKNKNLSDNKSKISLLIKEKEDIQKSISTKDEELKKINVRVEEIKKLLLEITEKIKDNNTKIESNKNKAKENKDEIERLKKEITDNNTSITNANLTNREITNLKREDENKLSEKRKTLEEIENF